MRVKWLGQSCFLITSDAGIKIITDPYAVGDDLNYGEIEEAADIVTISHKHRDHSNVSAVRGNPKVVEGPVTVELKGIKFKGIPTYHDEAGGTLRGNNTIFCFEVDGIGICHLGDLNHQLSDAQTADLGEVNILLIPVGGFFTIDAKVASQICSQLKPEVIIPMHYKNDKCNYPIAGVDEFLRGKEGVSRSDTSEEEFKKGELPATTQIIVLKSAL